MLTAHLTVPPMGYIIFILAITIRLTQLLPQRGDVLFTSKTMQMF